MVEKLKHERKAFEEKEQVKVFGGKELTSAMENYLEIIFRLEVNEGAARAGAIADAAGVSRSTVTNSLKVLKAMGLVEYSPYSLIRLTDEGVIIGRDIAHRHFVFQEFLENILLIEPEEADNVACMLEHVTPPEVIKRLGQFALFLKSRPDMWKDWRTSYKEEGLSQHAHALSAGMGDSRVSKLQPPDMNNPYR